MLLQVRRFSGCFSEWGCQKCEVTRGEPTRKTGEREVRVGNADPASGSREVGSTGGGGFRQPAARVLPGLPPGLLLNCWLLPERVAWKPAPGDARPAASQTPARGRALGSQLHPERPQAAGARGLRGHRGETGRGGFAELKAEPRRTWSAGGSGPIMTLTAPVLVMKIQQRGFSARRVQGPLFSQLLLLRCLGCF